MKNIYTIIIVSLLSANIFGQDAEKMRKYLKVTFNDKYDKTATISFDHTIPNKHGFDEISASFKNAFASHNFTIKDNPRYILTMDYKYGYVIAQYRMQYSNLTAQILDMNNNKTVVATIVYDGRFELDPVANAIAVELNKAKAPKVATTTVVEKQKAPTTKSKEEKLSELKNLYEKQLITQEDYDKQKAKILAED